MKDKAGPGTKCVHAGEDRHGRHAPLTTEIVQAAVFAVPNVKSLRKIVRGDSPEYYYSRNANPTVEAAERKIAALEGGAGAVVTSSGMSAVLCAVLAVCQSGDEIVSMLDVYGGTIKLFDVVLPKLGIRTTWVPYGEIDRLEKFLSRDTKLLFLESPTNPALRSVDLRKLAEIGHRQGATVLADNTFATPILQRPLELGCDISMHSATKYLGGHSDLTAGAVVANNRELVARIREVKIATGGVLDPGAAWLLLRGLKTLELRVEKACANAKKIARWLARQPKVKRVLYPGSGSHPGHAIARRQMKDYGAMIAFDIRGGGRAAERFIDRLQLWYLATSLGGVESTVSYPVLASHANCTPEQMRLLDVTPGLVRLSVGIEDPSDLIADLEQALG